jgi:DNA-directed RNA polymerase subunit RPC12/RpoP
MAIKYICDDCGAELGEFDNIASQLDMTGHVYCSTCYPKHKEEREPRVYSYVNKKVPFLKGLASLHNDIAKDTWPNGWDVRCQTCGKELHLSTEECGQCLAHGWPICCGHTMIGEKSAQN